MMHFKNGTKSKHKFISNEYERVNQLHDSIVVSIPACHAGDRGSIPRRGVLFYLISSFMLV